MNQIIVIRGGGDLASGIAIRLFRAGFRFIITELSNPLTVRRTVSFSEAIYSGTTLVENISARRVSTTEEIFTIIPWEIPIIIDENMEFIFKNIPEIPVIIDARMEKQPIDSYLYRDIPYVIGLGPGFIAGKDCHVVIETNRGHSLGRIYRQGKATKDTGFPAGDPTRVLRAPKDGVLLSFAQIGDIVSKDQVIAIVDNEEIRVPFKGLIRGLIHDGHHVQTGMKIGDLDHRLEKEICYQVSDKALAIGGSVLEVILSDTNLLPINKRKKNH